ncbi:MAG: hypothetical protein Q9219_003988 [cf. Caloplaca sp. 3 TL-2023]
MGQDAGSDYGSDFTPDEEDILSSLLGQSPSTLQEDPALILKDLEDDESPQFAKIPRLQEDFQQQSVSTPLPDTRRKLYSSIKTADESNLSADVESGKSQRERDRNERSVSIEAPVHPPPAAAQPEEPDLRSPLERFRSKPKKTLSVTDLISPSWCELQYWFTLTKHGRKKRTPAMKQGSAVHKTLEEEVHRTVAVNITTKEDAWGLRFWNIIQGLRTLRETGMTRELEVWGVLDGQVVNGVIDELSYVCPDRELEASQPDSKNGPAPLPADQKTITDFLSPNGLQHLIPSNFNIATPFSTTSSSKMAPSIYITDVKTRNSPSVPKAASFRPTLMQLMLYHRLLSDMAANKVDTSTLFSRYALQPDEPFTDAFIAQISELGSGAFSQTSETDPSSSPVNADYDTVDLLLAHNSLSKLWALMMQELHTTFPRGENSLGNVLKAEYRNAADGVVMGEKSFLFDRAVLERYVADELRWWRGERQAVGVCLEEAYKCRSCEFAEECGWRKGKIEEAREKVRMGRGRGRSEV